MQSPPNKRNALDEIHPNYYHSDLSHNVRMKSENEHSIHHSSVGLSYRGRHNSTSSTSEIPESTTSLPIEIERNQISRDSDDDFDYKEGEFKNNLGRRGRRRVSEPPLYELNDGWVGSGDLKDPLPNFLNKTHFGTSPISGK